ncbi:MAG TPA: class I SAM-dependent methyltransferase [Candidatus Udaeobacter sp.]|nr:class I SAM-dependent methyltransferase [Candidatus Udaeobacter sp.]
MITQYELNAYTQRWFASFHLPISDARTTTETDFVCSCAPLPEFRAVIDVCCGMGRHARALSERGYVVTGIDRDSSAIAKARDWNRGPRYFQADLRDYQPQTSAYDAAIVMGQSFGHFNTATNRAVLGRLATGVRERGRIILDLWNPDFFILHQGKWAFELPDGVVRETKRIRDDRLFVHLTYPSGEQEDFEWQLFTRATLQAIATPLGLTVVICCAEFDASVSPSASTPRVQFVMDRIR